MVVQVGTVCSLNDQVKYFSICSSNLLTSSLKHALQIRAMKTMIISKMMTTCFHVQKRQEPDLNQSSDVIHSLRLTKLYRQKHIVLVLNVVYYVPAQSCLWGYNVLQKYLVGMQVQLVLGIMFISSCCYGQSCTMYGN